MRIEHPTAAQIPQLRHLWKCVFGDSDAFLDSFFTTAYSPDDCRCILIDGEIAAVLYWMDCSLDGQKLAYLYAVATHPDHRGKGFCRGLMQDTHKLLRGQGYAGVVLVPQDEGLRRMYGKLGYENAGGMEEIACFASNAPAALRAVGPAEFASLRRNLLPEHAVIQEGPALSFLAQQLQFYAGDGILLAGYAENGRFQGTELLGGSKHVPGILKALDCSSGTFRVPGTAPFAMFYSLAADVCAPAYFGFAFD